MRFFERFRRAVGRYATGVHDLGAPAAPSAIAAAEQQLGSPVPEAYRDFLSQWNGGTLFHDDYALFGVAGARAGLAGLERLAQEAGRLRFGEAPGADLFLDERGRVLARDAETEEVRVVGSGFESWLDATMAAEGVLYGSDGEFRGEVFEGGELSLAARRRRAQAAIKLDPDAPGWHAALGEALLEEGDGKRAIAAFDRAVALEPTLASAWFALGRLHRETGAAAEAAVAFARAAAAEAVPEEAAFGWAQAARAAAEAGRPAEAAEHARRAGAAAPAFVAEQRAAAEHLAADGDLDGAIERLSLAAAVAGEDTAVRGQLAHLRARRALRPRSDE